MALAVRNRTINGIVNRRFALASHTVARQMSIAAADWDRIRMGFTLAISAPAGSVIASTPRLRFGFCSGTANVVPDDPAHALYLETTDASWAAASEATDGYDYFEVTGFRGMKSESGAKTQVTTFAGTARIASTSGLNQWALPVWCEINKQAKSGNNGTHFDFTLAWPIGTVGTGKRPAQASDVIVGLEDTAMTDIDANVTLAEIAGDLSTVGYTAQASSEVTFGAFDSVFVSWEHASVQAEIGEMYVAIKG